MPACLLDGHNGTGIPRLIHQFGHFPAARMSPLLRATVHLRRRHTGWCVHLWSDAEIDQLMGSNGLYRNDVYLALPVGVMRADMARYAILHAFGGWYADTDVLCEQQVDQLAAPGEQLVLAVQPAGKNGEEPQLGVSNFLMGSVAGHPIWLATLEVIAARVRARLGGNGSLHTRPGNMRMAVLEITGAIAMSQALVQMRWPAGGGAFPRPGAPRAASLVENVPRTLLEAAGFVGHARKAAMRAGDRLSAVFGPSGAPVCYHLNFFSWGKSWRTYVAGAAGPPGGQSGGNKRSRGAALRSHRWPGRQQRRAKRWDVPAAALERIPPRISRFTANQPAAAETLAAIREQVRGSPSPTPSPSPLPSSQLSFPSRPRARTFAHVPVPFRRQSGSVPSSTTAAKKPRRRRARSSRCSA